MLLKKSDIERALERKLGCETQNLSHRVFLFSMNGRVVAKTHTSHGGDDDLGDFLIKNMADQLGVPKRLFIELVKCTKSRADIEAVLRQS